MPGGVEAVEDMESWQRNIWTTEAQEHAAMVRSQAAQPALTGKPHHRSRGHGQLQTSTSKGSWERPASSRSKSGPTQSQQGHSRSAKASSSTHRGTGGTFIPTAGTAPECDMPADMPGAGAPVGILHENSCSIGLESCTHEGAAAGHFCV